MFKFVCPVCMAFLLLTSFPPGDDFTKYKTVEAYEVQPGILAFPTYAEDGQVCEIGIETRHYSPELIRLDPRLSREQIDKTVDELVPSAVRGKKSEHPMNDMMVVTGPAMTTIVEYENVSVEIDSTVTRANGKKMTVENAAAVVRWKNRKCR